VHHCRALFVHSSTAAAAAAIPDGAAANVVELADALLRTMTSEGGGVGALMTLTAVGTLVVSKALRAL
jgi:hypothetical protein